MFRGCLGEKSVSCLHEPMKFGGARANFLPDWLLCPLTAIGLQPNLGSAFACTVSLQSKGQGTCPCQLDENGFHGFTRSSTVGLLTLICMASCLMVLELLSLSFSEPEVSNMLRTLNLIGRPRQVVCG